MRRLVVGTGYFEQARVFKEEMGRRMTELRAQAELAGWKWTEVPPDAVVITLPPYTEADIQLAEAEGNLRVLRAYAEDDARFTAELYDDRKESDG
jgi:hypothetical protein